MPDGRSYKDPVYDTIEANLEDGSGTKQTVITVANFKAYHQHQMDSRLMRHTGQSGRRGHTSG